jgi:hypothetical protein
MSFRGSDIVALQTVWSSGVGVSVGLEAGYTQLASGLGASLGRGFHLRRADQRIMVGCGAAAAIAGAFGAPLAGVFLSTGRRFCLSSIKTMVGVHPDVMARFDNGESADRTAPVAAAVWAFQKNKWGGGAMRFNGRAWERFGELQTGN